jgi:hypothetical protein
MSEENRRNYTDFRECRTIMGESLLKLTPQTLKTAFSEHQSF